MPSNSEPSLSGAPGRHSLGLFSRTFLPACLQMPQFDTATFFNQLFYLSFIFYLFYLLLMGTYLPALTRILKVRRKKLDQAQAQGSAFQEEQAQVLGGYELLLTQYASNNRHQLEGWVEHADAWVQQLPAQKESQEMHSTQQSYLSLATGLRAQGLLLQQTTRLL